MVGRVEVDSLHCSLTHSPHSFNHSATHSLPSLPLLTLAESLLSSEGRSIPAWGSAIFSPLCLCITPKTPEELSGFMKYAVALTRAHLMVSCVSAAFPPWL
jgi:hypothetical protein